MKPRSSNAKSPAKAPAEQVVKDIRRQTRRHFSAEDKIRIVLDGLRAKVNLLPLNEAPGIPFRRPADDRVNAFARVLADRGVIVSVRKSRGRDIRAACGQLIVEGERIVKLGFEI